MKLLIAMILSLVTWQSYAGSDQGGGGHLIVDSKGNLVPLDQYEESALGANFKLEEVCPVGLAQISVESAEKFSGAYLAALQKLEILKTDPVFRVAHIQLEKSLAKMKWYTCEKNLPTITDHRFSDKILPSEVVQFALQTKRGEVVFALPVVNKVLKTSNGIKTLETTILHEIALSTWSISREDLSKLVNGFLGQNKKVVQRLIGGTNDYTNLYLTFYTNSRKHNFSNSNNEGDIDYVSQEHPVTYKMKFYLENGDVLTLTKHTLDGIAADNISIGRDRKFLVVDSAVDTAKKKDMINYQKERLGGHVFNTTDKFIFDSRIEKICISDIYFNEKRWLQRHPELTVVLVKRHSPCDAYRFTHGC